MNQGYIHTVTECRHSVKNKGLKSPLILTFYKGFVMHDYEKSLKLAIAHREFELAVLHDTGSIDDSKAIDKAIIKIIACSK